jgi:large subunit ribosomal protein L22
MKEYKATQKYLIASPRKLRLVVALIKKMKPAEAIEKLPFASRRAAGDLAKVIKSALANAKNQGVGESDLIFKEIQIGEGPRLKRGRAASKGSWHPFKRRMSHIRVVLTTLNKQISNKQISKSEKEVSEKVEKGKNGTKS